MAITWPVLEAGEADDAPGQLKAAAAAGAEVLSDQRRQERETLRLVAYHLDTLERELRAKLAGGLSDFKRAVLSDLLADATRLIEQTRRQLEAVASQAITKAEELGDQQATAPLAAAGLGIERKLPGLDQTIVAATARNTAALLTETMQQFTDQVRAGVRSVTLAGTGQFEAIQKLQRSIASQGIPNAAYKAERIIRTEVGRTFNAATFARLVDLARGTNFPFLRKCWRSTDDSRVRQGHQEVGERYKRGQGIKIAEAFEVPVYSERPGDADPKLLGIVRMLYPIDPAATPAGRLAAAATILCRCNAFVDFDAAELRAHNSRRVSMILGQAKPPLPAPRIVARIRFVPAGETPEGSRLVRKTDTFAARVEFPAVGKNPTGGWRAIAGFKSYEDAVAKLGSLYPGLLIIDETEGRRPQPKRRAVRPKEPKIDRSTNLLPLDPKDPNEPLARQGPSTRAALLEKDKAFKPLRQQRENAAARIRALNSEMWELEWEVREAVEKEFDKAGRAVTVKGDDGIFKPTPEFVAERMRRVALVPKWANLKAERDAVQVVLDQILKDPDLEIRRFMDRMLTQKGPDNRLTLGLSFAPNVSADVRASVEKAASILERWVRNPDGSGAIRRLAVSPTDDVRSNYTPFMSRINMGTKNLGVAVHEIGHYLEEALPGWHEQAVAFLVKRTEGLPAQHLSKFVPDAKWRPDEFATKDGFLEAYAGKWYVLGGGPFTGWTGRGSVVARVYATEVVSMGVELLHNDPLRFAREDPDFFEFMIDLLNGTLPAVTVPTVIGHVPQK